MVTVVFSKILQYECRKTEVKNSMQNKNKSRRYTNERSRTNRLTISTYNRCAANTLTVAPTDIHTHYLDSPPVTHVDREKRCASLMLLSYHDSVVVVEVNTKMSNRLGYEYMGARSYFVHFAEG